MEKRTMFQRADLRDTLPFASETFDFCLDLYTFCHFLDDDVKRNYVQELYRVTKTRGYVISALFSFEDQYYARFLKSSVGKMTITDPINGITKELYNREDYRSAFSPPFAIEYCVDFEFTDVVLGRSFRRAILAMA